MEMRALATAELLETWERGLELSPPQRALAILGASTPNSGPEALGRLSVGERDACLLTLREWTFGPRLAGTAQCLQCGEAVEFVFHVADVRQQPGPVPPVLVVTNGEFVVQCRHRAAPISWQSTTARMWAQLGRCWPSVASRRSTGRRTLRG